MVFFFREIGQIYQAGSQRDTFVRVIANDCSSRLRFKEMTGLHCELKDEFKFKLVKAFTL